MLRSHSPIWILISQDVIIDESSTRDCSTTSTPSTSILNMFPLEENPLQPSIPSPIIDGSTHHQEGETLSEREDSRPEANTE